MPSYRRLNMLAETGADFAYSDEALLKTPEHPRPETTSSPTSRPECLMAVNYICHLAVFKELFEGRGRQARSVTAPRIMTFPAAYR